MLTASRVLQDDFPLASLPLLGYSVTTPAEADNIHKEYVFKLQFKNHVYFFRAESEYTFGRSVRCLLPEMLPLGILLVRAALCLVDQSVWDIVHVGSFDFLHLHFSFCRVLV